MYKVDLYIMKSGLFGTKMREENAALAEFLNLQEKNGWHLVSMCQLQSNSNDFQFQLVFRKDTV